MKETKKGEKSIICKLDVLNTDCLLGIVLDATLSFTSIYPQIYYYLERLLIGLKQIQVENPSIVFRYSLVLLKNETEQVLFSENSVTEDESELLDALSEINFSGGSRDGKENLTKAICFQLEKMEKQATAQTQKGILLLSDAVVSGEGGFADLTNNTGIRFAYLFSGDDSYLPQFRITDSQGHLTENEQNTCIYASITELLAETEEEEVQLAEKMAKEMAMRFMLD